MKFDIQFAISILPSLWRASLTALLLTAASSALACLLGMALELGRRTGRWQNLALTLVIDAVRVTPLVVQLYFAFFVLPEWGLALPPLVIGVLCLGGHYSSYLAEVFKAGFEAIPAGQLDAAKALGMQPWQIALLVTIPLVIRNSLPTMGNYFLSILKATPYLSLIAVNELLGTAFSFASQTFRYYEPFAVLGIFFLVYSALIGWLVRWLEGRVLRRFGAKVPARTRQIGAQRA